VEIRELLVPAVEAVVVFVQNNNPRAAEIGAVRRVDRWMLPPSNAQHARHAPDLRSSSSAASCVKSAPVLKIPNDGISSQQMDSAAKPQMSKFQIPMTNE